MADLKVIGAGFGRTGTMSLYTALEKLGFKTHHMKTVIKNPKEVPMWYDITFKPDSNFSDYIDAIYAPYDAAVDHPSCMFYKELLAHSPNAKVILTVRDPMRWLESCKETIWFVRDIAYGTPGKYFLPFNRFLMPQTTRFAETMGELVWGQHFLRDSGITDINDPRMEALVKQRWADWIDEVKRNVPADQLLIYEVKQGWEPLCEFLGKPVPDEPFPNVNSREEFGRGIFFARLMWFAVPITAGAALAGAGAFLYKKYLSQ